VTYRETVVRDQFHQMTSYQLLKNVEENAVYASCECYGWGCSPHARTPLVAKYLVEGVEQSLYASSAISGTWMMMRGWSLDQGGAQAEAVVGVVESVLLNLALKFVDSALPLRNVGWANWLCLRPSRDKNLCQRLNQALAPATGVSMKLHHSGSNLLGRKNHHWKGAALLQLKMMDAPSPPSTAALMKACSGHVYLDV